MNSLANINTASNNQANSNSNNNNANVINVMPPGKKKRRRRSDKICVKSSESSVSGEVSLAAMFLVLNILKSQHRPGECGPPLTCRAVSQLDSLGLGGKMMSVGPPSQHQGAQLWRCGVTRPTTSSAVADWGDFLLDPLSHLSYLLHQK